MGSEVGYGKIGVSTVKHEVEAVNSRVLQHKACSLDAGAWYSAR